MDSVYITYISVQFININKQNPRVLTLNTKYPHHTYIKKRYVCFSKASLKQTKAFFFKRKKATENLIRNKKHN